MNTLARITTCIAITLLLSVPTNISAQDSPPEGFTALFDGKSLDGWEQKNGTATYEVVDGTILGKTATGSPNSFLCTTKDYSDFELHFETKVDDDLNSGVQIRSLSKPDFKEGRVHGPQVEIEAGEGESGFIYSEGTGRNWISKPSAHKHFKDGDWNSYRVVADGNRIQVWVNGTHIEDLDVPAIESKAGFIGLQVHSIGKDKGPFQVQWRNIYIKEIAADAVRVAQASNGTPEIDGEIDDVWKNAKRIVTNREVEEHNSLEEGKAVSTASVRCLWDDGHLYCLAEVTDDNVTTEAYEDWAKDSIEFFVDGDMDRASSYGDADGQYRTNAAGEMTGGSSTNLENYKSAVKKTETGYIVEACIKLNAEAGKKIGFDVQVNNDPGSGGRESTAKWNDPTNNTWEDLSAIGTLELVGDK
jgi:hypothetical protein